jgi:hypothetical protein
VTYTTHGLMTAADLEEYRRDYDWSELRQPESQDDDGCVHGRLLAEDCAGCEQECASDETR